MTIKQAAIKLNLSQQAMRYGDEASEKMGEAAFKLNPRRVVVVLSQIAIFLVLANIGVNLIKLITGDRSFHGLVPLFQLSAENNIPSFYSECLFLLNAVLFFFVWLVRRAISWRQIIWVFLAGIFIFLGYDELFRVHEQLIEPIRQMMHTTGLLYFAWVLAYGLGVIVLALAFFPIWWRLDNTIKWLLAASAVVYLTGAIGFEMLGGAYYEAVGGDGGIIYGALYTIEESLEMAGLIILTYSLLLLLNKASNGFSLIIPPFSQISSLPSDET